jgi:tetratricopeptide (TPR) repeat protein
MWRLGLKLNRLATAADPNGTKRGAQSRELRAKNKALKRELQAKSKELAARIGEYRQRGEFDEAIAMLQSALEERSYPDRAIFEHLAEAYFAKGGSTTLFRPSSG